MPLPDAELHTDGLASGGVVASSDLGGLLFSVLFTGDGAGNLSTGWGIGLINYPAAAQAVIDWFVPTLPADGQSLASLLAAWRAVFDGSPGPSDYDPFDFLSSTRLNVTLPDPADFGISPLSLGADLVQIVIDSETPFIVTNGAPRSGFPISVGTFTVASDVPEGIAVEWPDLRGILTDTVQASGVTLAGTYAPIAGGTVPVRVELVEESVDSEEVDRLSLVARVELAELGDANAVGQTLTLEAVAYTIVEQRPEPDGWVALLLQ